MLHDKKRQLIIMIMVFLSGIMSEDFIAQTENNNLEKFVERSEVIARGKVSDLMSEWDKEKSCILTKVSIDVSENYKGPETGKLVITHLGGEIGDVGELYSHQPKFIQDEEVLIFAKRDKANNLRLTKGVEGKFKITTDQTTGEKKIGSFKSLNEFSARIKSIIKK